MKPSLLKVHVCLNGGSPTLIMHSKFQDEMLHPNKFFNTVEAHIIWIQGIGYVIFRGELRKGGGGS